MRFTRPHTHNGHHYEAGDSYTGNISIGRFLHQRGVLEPDGAPDDDAITAKASKPAWHGDTADETPTTAEPQTTRRRSTRATRKDN